MSYTVASLKRQYAKTASSEVLWPQLWHKLFANNGQRGMGRDCRPVSTATPRGQNWCFKGPSSGVGAPQQSSWLVGWSQSSVPMLSLITTATHGTWTPACLKWRRYLASSSHTKNSFIWRTDKICKHFLSYQLLPNLKSMIWRQKASLTYVIVNYFST